MTIGFLNLVVPLWLLVAVGILLLIGIVAAVSSVRRRNFVDFPVQKRSRLFTPAEKIFFERLKESLLDDYDIFAKVPMLNVVESSPIASGGLSRLMRERLYGKQFDFVLCKKHDLSIFGVVELESFEKKRSDRSIARRKKLVSAICKSAHMRLFYFDVRQDYKDVDIRRLVTGKSSNNGRHKGFATPTSELSQMTVDNTSYAAFSKQRSCPQCNGEVVTKVAIKGKHIGEKFLMCRKYPYCDYRVSVEDQKVVRQIEGERSVAQRAAKEPGYRDWSI